MKRILSLMLVLIMAVFFAACAGETKDIEGTITGYVQVEEYTKPLAVIANSGKICYLALVGDAAAYAHGHEDDELLAAIQKGEITGIKVSIDEAEKGKTIDIDGNKATVWQSHQIHQTE